MPTKLHWRAGWEAKRRLGISYHMVQRLALLKKIRIRIDDRNEIEYCHEDIERLAPLTPAERENANA